MQKGNLRRDKIFEIIENILHFKLDNFKDNYYNMRMELNYDVLNYLNLVNERFGEMYMKRNFNPMPANFVLTNDLIVERMNFKGMQKEVSLPEFLYADKKVIFKKFHHSYKNVKRLEKFLSKNEGSLHFSPAFKERLVQYLAFRKAFLKSELKNFGGTSFFEYKSIQRLNAIDPVFSELFEETFLKNIDVALFFEGLEEKYAKLYEALERKAKEKERQRLEIMVHNMAEQKTSKRSAQKSRVKSREVTKTIEETGNLERIEKENKVKETFGESKVSKHKTGSSNTPAMQSNFIKSTGSDKDNGEF